MMPSRRHGLFVRAFQRMSEGAQASLVAIYNRAYTDGSVPETAAPSKADHHVVMAMRAAIRHPELFQLTMMNLVTRVVMKVAKTTGDQRLLADKMALLEDFHSALDVFCKSWRLVESQIDAENVSLQAGLGDWSTDPLFAYEENEPLENLQNFLAVSQTEMLAEVLTFKTRSRPVVDRIRRFHHRVVNHVSSAQLWLNEG